MLKAMCNNQKMRYNFSFKYSSFKELTIYIQIKVESFSQDGLSYDIKVEDCEIVGCSFMQAALACKHIFLAQCVSPVNIHLKKAIVPAAQPLVQPNEAMVAAHR
jgi:hypothetical protein